MKHSPLLTFLIVLFCIISGTCGELTRGERTALFEILEQFPDLRYVPRWESYDWKDTYYGRPWTGDFSNVCQSPGYDLFGIHCSEGHVDGIRITSLWGEEKEINWQRVYSSIDQLKSLTFLINEDDRFYHLTDAILNEPGIALKHLDGMRTTPKNEESIQTVSGSFTTNRIQMKRFTNLRKVVAMDVADSKYDWSTAPTTLEEIKTICDGCNLFKNFGRFPALKKVELRDSVLPQDTVISSNSIESIEVFGSPFSAQITSSSLESFMFTQIRGGNTEIRDNVTLETPHLRILKLPYPHAADLEKMPKLESLEFKMMNGEFSTFPVVGSMKRLIFDSTVFSPDNFASTICDILTLNPSMEYVDLSSVQSDSASELSLPSCVKFTSLKTIKFSSESATSFVPSFNVTSLNENLPSTLTHLAFSEPLDESTLFRLANLTVFEGALESTSPDFFFRMTQLKNFTCSAPNITLPTIGWEKFEKIDVVGDFVEWRVIHSTAINLKVLRIRSSSEMKWPDEEDFIGKFPSLSELDIDCEGELPPFWAILPKLRKLKLSRVEGNFPFSLTLPRVERIQIDSTKLCGSLPDITLRTMAWIQISKNPSLGGTIPLSWADLLIPYAVFHISSQPSLVGTIPSKLFNRISKPYTAFLVDTSFSGPLWDVSWATSGPELILERTGIDLCARNPRFQYQARPKCDFTNIPVCPDSCPSYWENCRTEPNCTTSSIPRAPIIDNCQVVPMEPLPPADPIPPPQNAPVPEASVPRSAGTSLLPHLPKIIICLLSICFLGVI